MLRRVALLNDGSVNKGVCRLFGLVVVDNNFMISIDLFRGIGTLTMFNFMVSMRSLRISMVRHGRNLLLLYFLGTDRLVVDFLGIDMGCSVMSWIVTPGIAVVSVTISTNIAVVVVSSAMVMITIAIGGAVVSMTNVPCLVVSMVVRITVVLGEFNVGCLMLGLVVVSGVEAVSIAVVAVVSMCTIAIAMAIDTIVTFSSDGGTVISMNTESTVAMISRCTIVSVDGIGRSTVGSISAISVSNMSAISVSAISVSNRVVAVVSKFMLVRTSGHLSNTTTEFMVIDGPMVSHNVLNNLLRGQDLTLHVRELHILVVSGIGSLLVVLAFRLTVG